MEEARRKGAVLWSIVNAVGSQAMRLADGAITMQAGPEIGVASTKAFTASIVDQYLLACLLGELRGTETVSFLRAINTGHPGSFSTVHANSPRGALEQIALMAMQTGIGLTRAETLEYAASVIDIVVQLDRNGGRRGVSDIAVSRSLVG